jgi:3-hydroxyacyl-CoA dehydrogenase/3a,7a,12a-trihydroxy-5b-cholest-24-enoyl-CoA hydratase
MSLRFDGRVAVVTGAGGGLGRAYALLLASRGASVVVNDLGGTAGGQGSDQRAADAVVGEIKRAGGRAVANYDSVVDGEKIVETALRNFGKVDVLICNAGILRDRSFLKMDAAAWDAVVAVHLSGAFACARAAWPHMRDAGYGRIVFITSASGIYGNFGQSNYASAKMGMVGLAHTLSKEGGERRGILVNSVAPIAASRMTEGMFPPDLLAALQPEAVAPVVAYLCHESCSTNGAVFELGGGWASRLRWQRSQGAFLDVAGGRPPTIEAVAAAWPAVSDFAEGATYPETTQAAFAPMMDNLARAPAAGAAGGAAGAGAGGSPSLPRLPGGTTGGSEAVDVAATLAHPFRPVETVYTERDTVLYALSVGAGLHDPTDPRDLPFVYELAAGGLRALPTMAVLWPFAGMAEISSLPSLRFNPMMLLHGEQELAVAGALPAAAALVTTTRVSNVYDKGSGAVVVVEAETREKESRALLAVNRSSIFLRGVGNFGGDRGPAPEAWTPPSSSPTFTDKVRLPPSAALVYRLNGDTNPLHADPDMASLGGFRAPILHGLCTFGVAGRVVLRRFGGGGAEGEGAAAPDPSTLRSIKARFSKHVFPGETVVVESWDAGEGRVLFQCRVEERGNEVVLSNGVAVFGRPVARL